MTANCPEAIVLLMTQSLFGVIVQCVMAGVVLAKLARAKYRAETIMFSKNAVICQEDGEYCLLFRVGDMRRSQLVGKYSRVPNKRIDTFIFSKQIRLFWQVLTSSRAILTSISTSKRLY